MAFHSNFFFTLLISSYVISLVDANNNGITIDLIHRDSPLSPFYNPNITRFERLRNAFHRSLARKTSLNPTSISTTDSFQELLKNSVGEYLMKISIGTPPVEILAIADTGSDLLWTKCLPCKKCEQNGPLFDPRKSTSYMRLSCGSKLCHDLGKDGYCGYENKYCQYDVSYRDKSHSKGDLAEETISLQSNSGKPVPFKVAFGCGHDNHGNSEETVAAGIIGLGGGDLSLVNQLYKSIGGKFSYCLTQMDESHSPSKISFGSKASVSGPKVVSTPLIKKRSDDTSYYLNLEGITVGTNRLNYETTSVYEQGNIIIDSGTTLTYFPKQFYQKLKSALVKVIKEKPDPKGEFESKLCYRTNREDFDAPKIVVHFTDADLELSSTSTFIEVENGRLCLTMVPSKDSTYIFGNLNQMNQLVGYDLVKNKVSFMPTDCSKYP